jgi:hypothetical protein
MILPERARCLLRHPAMPYACHAQYSSFVSITNYHIVKLHFWPKLWEHIPLLLLHFSRSAVSYVRCCCKYESCTNCFFIFWTVTSELYSPLVLFTRTVLPSKGLWYCSPAPVRCQPHAWIFVWIVAVYYLCSIWEFLHLSLDGRKAYWFWPFFLWLMPQSKAADAISPGESFVNIWKGKEGHEWYNIRSIVTCVDWAVRFWRWPGTVCLRYLGQCPEYFKSQSEPQEPSSIELKRESFSFARSHENQHWSKHWQYLNISLGFLTQHSAYVYWFS